jgi:hypothetical protein
MALSGIWQFIGAVERTDRVRVRRCLKEPIEVADGRKVDGSLPRVGRRDRLGRVRLAEDHPRPSLLDQVLA